MLPVIHRFGFGSLVHWTLLYLALPLPLFIFGWLKPAYALPLTALLLYLLFKCASEITTNKKQPAYNHSPRRGGVRQRNKRWRWGGSANAIPLTPLLTCALVALLWTALSGAGGIGLQNGDHLKHNAILKTLILFDWPAGLDSERMLVYAIGYYLPAAAVGKLCGWAAANLAQFIWTLIGVWLTLLWFVRLARGSALWLAPLFVLLSGMDVILWHFFHPEPLQWGRHLEWATGKWHFQFSSMSTLLFWTPQHALPGWLGAALFLHLRDSPGFHRGAPVLIACSFLWSVFAALGLALLMLVWLALNPHHWRTALWPPNALLRHAGAALLLLTLALFLLSNSFTFPSGFFIGAMTELGLWPRYSAFLLGEYALVGICALLLMRLRGGHPLAGLLAAVMATLACLHLYKVSGDPDLAMRASIPLLFVFWCIVCSSCRGLVASRLSARVFAGALQAAMLAAVLIGAVTPYMEIHRSITHYRMSPLPLARVKDLDNFSPWPAHMQQYFGSRQSLFFQILAKPPRLAPAPPQPEQSPP